MTRGSIYELTAPRDATSMRGAIGREQQGRRFAVVVQSDDLPLSTWIVCPTSTRKLAASFRPEITINGQTTRILVEHLVSIDPQQRLGRQVGFLSADELRQVDRALRVVLGLDLR